MEEQSKQKNLLHKLIRIILAITLWCDASAMCQIDQSHKARSDAKYMFHLNENSNNNQDKASGFQNKNLGQPLQVQDDQWKWLQMES